METDSDEPKDCDMDTETEELMEALIEAGTEADALILELGPERLQLPYKGLHPVLQYVSLVPPKSY
jgi:hypothetical protein